MGTGPGSTCVDTTIRTEPTYASEGLLHSLRNGSQSRNILYFGNRPVALQTGAQVRYLTTDHLGTPVLMMDATGATIWQGGFEPFGLDWNGAQTAGQFLRFPGQWEDAAWSSSDGDLGQFQNVHRWYENQTGRYDQADPLGLQANSRLEPPAHLFSYVGSRPIRFKDRLGLFTMDDSCECLIGRDSGHDAPSRSAYAHLVSSVAQACASRLSGITDVSLRRCVAKSCDQGVIICRKNCPQGQIGGTTDVAFAKVLRLAGRSILSSKICVNKWSELTAAGAGNVALHEWAHGCGWTHAKKSHDPGLGVPGPHGSDF